MTRLEGDERDVAAGVVEIIATIAELPAAVVVPGAQLSRDLDIDSLSLVEVAAAIQDRFHVLISDDDLVRLKTVADVVEHLRRVRSTP